MSAAGSGAVVRDAGVTAAAGFSAAGVAAGLKTSGALDVALVRNDGPELTAAGVFTRNKVQAAPVLWSRQVLSYGRVRAVVLNSGGANACTGSPGFVDTHTTAEAVAAALSGAGTSTGAAEVAVCSTGLIGDRLPMAELLAGVEAVVPALAGGPAAGLDAARAVMTTDSVPKQASLVADGVTVGGLVKGAGMLAPSLATMLCVLTTDAVATAADLDAALRAATAVTLDRLDVDGATSTNDTVLLLASGASGVTPDLAALTATVTAVLDDLAEQLMADAEGATKHVTITVSGAASEADALATARTVARDSLVKTALFGSDPNWGRVVAAVGMAPAHVDPDRISVSFDGAPVCVAGVGAPGARDVDLSAERISLEIDLGVGEHSAAIRTTDLSHGYVEENSAYSS